MSEVPVQICAARYDDERVEALPCPTCQSDQEFLCQFEAWYGWTLTCLNCGDRWTDGELCPRPFQPRWRELRLMNAKKKAAKLGWKKDTIRGEQ